MLRGAPAAGKRAVWLLPLVCLVATALFFPRTGAAGLALVVLVAASGAAVAWTTRGVRLALPRWAPDALVAGAVVTASAVLFRETWSQSGLRWHDWGPHHANLKNLIDGLKRGGVPRWVQGVSTGDSPYELYPLLAYWLMARAAILTHATDLTLVLVRTAIVTHTLAALGGGLLARRLLGWGWGVVVGLVMLFDVGSVWGGGVDGLFKLGVLHAAMANAVYPFALLAVVDALRRPTLASSVRIWLSVALAIACHPLALTSALATAVALVLVALVARDVPPHRALACALHVSLGVALVAGVFLPLNARMLEYAVHFALAGQRSFEQFGTLLTTPVPQATLGPLIFAGNLGVVVGLASRRAAPTLLAGTAGLLLFFLVDQPYTLLDLLPSLEGARFQTTRLASASKASVYVLGCYVLSLVLGRAAAFGATRTRVAVSSGRARLVLGAVTALGLALLLRTGGPYVERLANTLRSYAHADIPDEAGMQAVAAWARTAARAATPGRYGRLLHEDERRYFSVYHLNALSGLPTLWVGSVSCLFLRERIEDASPASLRRFDVRWVMRRDEPPSLGDPASERRFGRYFVRELPEWDGHFARVERGGGEAVVTRLDDERVDVDLGGTSAPALVALGTGYYPRWRATHETRGALPVYAFPTVPGSTLSVPAAWLPPGRTTFRPDGPLPSDGRGTWISLLALAAALGGIGVWRHAATRGRILRALAGFARSVERRQRAILLVAWLGLGAVVLGAGIASGREIDEALEVGGALRGVARVESRTPNGPWRPCSYSMGYGAYHCRGALLVQDSVNDMLNDALPSPPFAVPSIVVSASEGSAEVRIHVPARLAGEYWAQSDGGETRLASTDGVSVTLDGSQKSLLFSARNAPRDLTLETSVGAGQVVKIAVVRRDTLDPDRHYPRAPATPPGSAR
jgi:hypothetical protein